MITRLFLFVLIALISGRAAAQQTTTVNGKELLLLPYYPFDTSFLTELDDVKSHVPGDNADFASQLNDAALETFKAGGNVFQVTKVQDGRQDEAYIIRGKAWHTDKYEEVRLKAMRLKKKNLDNGECALLTIYRPGYTRARNDELFFDLVINDTLAITMKANMKYVIKVNKDCNVKIATEDKGIVQHINVKRGNNYYVRALTTFPGAGKQVKVGEMMVPVRGYDPYFEIINESQGELESSVVTKVIIKSKQIGGLPDIAPATR